ncbi:MAG TPA: alkaline phosphatase [Solirubrobacterales bacterium]|nr:alkaline phosphatase [Solirubrobacterales bacterium]
MSFGKRLFIAMALVLVAGGTAIGVAKVKKPATDPADKTNWIRKQIVGGQARNVILFIGDGTDETVITAARNYWLGAGGRFTMDRLRISGSVTTYAMNELMGSEKPFYVTDSAASGTAWATGRKTGLFRISTAPFTGEAMPTIAELAQKNGYRTGNVTTDSVTGATPAVQMAHVRLRNCETPEDEGVCDADMKSNGGLGSIAEQAADSKMDVILGGGLSDFEKTIPFGPDAGKTVLESAQRQGFDLVTDSTGLAGYQGNRRLLGLFSGGGMTPEWSGQRAVDSGAAAQRCQTDQRPAEQPALSTMTRRAIQILGKKSKGQKKGFFLQVEAGDPDKGAHRADPCWSMGGVVALNEAVKAGLEFARKNPRTLLIVTGDHGQSGQIIPFNGASKTAVLTTNEGGSMVMGYATSKTGDQEHAGIPVPLRAQGPQAANLMGLHDQPEIFDTILRALKIRNPNK